MPRKKSSALRISEPSDLSSLSKRKRSMLSGSDDNRSTQEPISSPSLSPNRLSVAKQQRKTRSDFFQYGTSSESMSKGVSLDGARRMALKHIETFVLTFSDPLTFSSAAASSAPAALTQVTEEARIQEAGHLRCSGAEIGRFVIMLRNPSSVLKSCAAFALLQFTIPGGRHAMHHASIMQNGGAARILRAAENAPLEAKIFAKIVLRNLEHHHIWNHRYRSSVDIVSLFRVVIDGGRIHA